MALIMSLNEIVHERHFQSESENIFQKSTQNEDHERHSQIFPSQL